MPRNKSYGQLAYEAYFGACNGKSLVSGQALPAWAEQADNIKRAWELVALRIVEAVKNGE